MSSNLANQNYMHISGDMAQNMCTSRVSPICYLPLLPLQTRPCRSKQVIMRDRMGYNLESTSWEHKSTMLKVRHFSGAVPLMNFMYLYMV